MQLHFLGTCSGTEPMRGINHTSWALQTGDQLYFFDAGEGCSHTAHLKSLDALTIKAIFVSHPHIDHIGGLSNLVWLVEKLSWRDKKIPKYGGYDVYLPDMDIWEGVKYLLKYGNAISSKYRVDAHRVTEGIIFDDGEVRVIAFRNSHMGKYDCSFSYRIECEGKSIVYSGDVKSYCELDRVIGEHCTALICETGHHLLDDTYKYISNKNVDRVFYTHHGREILNDRSGCRHRVSEYFGDKAVICHDGLTVDI